VGPAFADESTCLGVGPASELRVVAINEATQKELMAREEHLLSIWNSKAKAQHQKTADRLVCWVNGDFFQGRKEASNRKNRPTQSQQRTAKMLREEELVPFLREAREEIAAAVSHPELREALIDLRARGLREAVSEGRESGLDAQHTSATGGETNG